MATPNPETGIQFTIEERATTIQALVLLQRSLARANKSASDANRGEVAKAISHEMTHLLQLINKVQLYNK